MHESPGGALTKLAADAQRTSQRRRFVALLRCRFVASCCWKTLSWLDKGLELWHRRVRSINAVWDARSGGCPSCYMLGFVNHFAAQRVEAHEWTLLNASVLVPVGSDYNAAVDNLAKLADRARKIASKI